LQYHFNQFLSVKTELFYERRGWTSDNNFEFDNSGNLVKKGSVRVIYSFVTFPLLLEVGYGKKLRFFANGGINHGIRIGGKSSLKDLQNYGSIAGDPSLKKPNIDYGYTYGGGLSFFHKQVKISLEYRFFRSFSPIGYLFNEIHMYHKGEMLSIGLGYRI
jgi:opacity protein-like surface antigen